MLDRIGLAKDDHLYLLGDYIDRGPDSSGVIDTILRLQEQNFNVFPLRGNHEENMLTAYHSYDKRMFRGFVSKINKSGDLLDEDADIIPKYYKFMNSLDYVFELEDYWLVHAGFNTGINNVLDDKLAMLESRRFEYNHERLKGKTVIHGHDVRYLDEIRNAIDSGSMIIPLDNGCVYSRQHRKYDYLQTGKLLCLDLDSRELVLQDNIDFD